MQSWCVLLYYGLLIVLTIFLRFVAFIRWWSSFILSLMLTYIVIIFTAPEVTTENEETSDLIFMFLLLLLAILSPILIFIYVASQSIIDQVERVCY